MGASKIPPRRQADQALALEFAHVPADSICDRNEDDSIPSTGNQSSASSLSAYNPRI